jgi:hypothetical protein
LAPKAGYVTEAGVPVNSGDRVIVALGMNCHSETGSVTRLYHGVGRGNRPAFRLQHNPPRRRWRQRYLAQGRGGAYITLAGAALPPRRYQYRLLVIDIIAPAQHRRASTLISQT